MNIVIDTKNFALYGGGIAHWFAPLLAGWVEHRSDIQFYLLGPGFKQDFLPASGNWTHVNITWPLWLPRSFRHPVYDNILFPRAVQRLKPDLVMSPYHDVRMPKGVPCVIGVHDLCFDELVGVYPKRIRAYYLTLLRSNLCRASHVITVSETSRNKLIERYSVPLERISVVYNATSQHFLSLGNSDEIVDFKRRHALTGRFLFYSGGSEYRKNIERLLRVFAVLAANDPGLSLLVTGNPDSRWHAALESEKTKFMTQGRVKFLGRLSDRDLRIAYAAADTVIYPSLCEGFGRVCLEAMEVGTPLACSDLLVMREVAGEYACYFDPYDIASMVAATAMALDQKRSEGVRDKRFQAIAVKASFLAAMDAVTRGL